VRENQAICRCGRHLTGRPVHSLPDKENTVLRVTLLCIPALLLLLTPGCVSKSAYQRKNDEVQNLTAAVADLESDYTQAIAQQKALAERHDELNRQLETVTRENAVLRQDKLRDAADITRLEKALSARSAETGAAMSEMRQTIDRLEQDKRELAENLEKERLARQARLAQLKNTYDELVDKMESEIQRGEVTISELQGKLTVNLVERILFDSGSAEIKPAGFQVLRRVGEILKGAADKEIRVEGHTDNVPISPRLEKTFPTNWELSTARACNVLRFLQGEIGISGGRLIASGYGPYRPIASNGTSAGRAQNRRIQIVLAPAEPGSPSGN
jgi:chemotaxis protein MotB